MGEIAEAMVDGANCAHCGVFFAEDHGYPVLCCKCYREATKAQRDGLQRAIHSEL